MIPASIPDTIPASTPVIRPEGEAAPTEQALLITVTDYTAVVAHDVGGVPPGDLVLVQISTWGEVALEYTHDGAVSYPGAQGVLDLGVDSNQHLAAHLMAWLVAFVPLYFAMTNPAAGQILLTPASGVSLVGSSVTGAGWNVALV